MKKFTFNDIKQFCKEHYEECLEGLEQSDVTIFFDFIGWGYVRKTSFSTLAQNEIDLRGTWAYEGCDMLSPDIYDFKFKRIA